MRTVEQLRALITEAESEHMILGMHVEDAEKEYEEALSRQALSRAHLQSLRKQLIALESGEPCTNPNTCSI